ncbi:MAG: radical SAM protein [Candidatus Aminicenantia bacterium]
MRNFIPSYISLWEKGEFKERVDKAWEILESCTLCPRNCRKNRLKGEKGTCKIGALPYVSSSHPHFGEESPLVGRYGSGTIFLTSCNLLCIYCQNYTISHLMEGEECSFEDLAKMMLSLQKRGCHNINFVTPTHQVPQILKSLEIAIQMGLNVPLVYNSSGYDSVETLRILEGIFDIYMPDLKYADKEPAKKFSSAEDYPEVVKMAIKEMHRQVGDLVIDEDGIALRGLLVRHLVLPNGLAGTKEAMRFIAEEISKNTYINIMDQYYPCYRAFDYREISRRIKGDEFFEALNVAREMGLKRLDKKEPRKIIIW